jgi:hypothetical protein
LIGITKGKGEERKEGEQQQQKREIQQIWCRFLCK